MVLQPSFVMCNLTVQIVYVYGFLLVTIVLTKYHNNLTRPELLVKSDTNILDRSQLCSNCSLLINYQKYSKLKQNRNLKIVRTGILAKCLLFSLVLTVKKESLRATKRNSSGKKQKKKTEIWSRSKLISFYEHVKIGVIPATATFSLYYKSNTVDQVNKF